MGMEGIAVKLKRLDHVNIRTARLEEQVAWYEAVLGLTNGPRPPFGFPGAWMYLDDAPIVHLVAVAAEPRSVEPKIEHFAISAEGLAGFLERLEAHEVRYSVDPVPEFPIVQVNFRDPDGNHIHVDFPSSERVS